MAKFQLLRKILLEQKEEIRFIAKIIVELNYDDVKPINLACHKLSYKGRIDAYLTTNFNKHSFIINPSKTSPIFTLATPAGVPVNIKSPVFKVIIVDT